MWRQTRATHYFYAMKNALCIALFMSIGLQASTQDIPDETKKILGKYTCGSCHSYDMRLIGPSWKELAQKNYSAKKLAGLLRNPEPINWPDYPPMAPIPNITNDEVKILAAWLKKLKNQSKHGK
jgi:cytochrome c